MSGAGENASDLIDQRIAALEDWRGGVLAQVRRLVQEAVPGVIEEVKWRGVPVWSADGILFTGETYKSAVKLTFMNGAALDDPHRLFNSSLEGNVRRAIDITEGAFPDEAALRALFQAAAERNRAAAAARKGKSRSKT